jgi:hypothetical protein
MKKAKNKLLKNQRHTGGFSLLKAAMDALAALIFAFRHAQPKRERSVPLL